MSAEDTSAVAELVVLHICYPDSRFQYRTIHHCPTCNRNRRMVVRMEMWYGDTFWCLGCGDAWSDGELMPRPFKRAWRKEAIARAQQMRCTDKRTAERAFMRELASYSQPRRPIEDVMLSALAPSHADPPGAVEAEPTHGTTPAPGSIDNHTEGDHR